MYADITSSFCPMHTLCGCFIHVLVIINIMQYLDSLELRLALIQLAVGASKSDNLLNAAKHVKQAASQGATLIALPVS
jgi:hypothetical protein